MLLKIIKINFLNVCHLSQRQDYKKTVSLPILVTKMIFPEIGWYTFFPLYLWAKYEPLGTDFTVQQVILSANMLVQAQTIPQNSQCLQFP